MLSAWLQIRHPAAQTIRDTVQASRQVFLPQMAPHTPAPMTEIQAATVENMYSRPTFQPMPPKTGMVTFRES